MKNRYEINGDIAVIFLNRKDGSTVETIIDTCDLDKAKSIKGTWYSGFNACTQSYYVKATICKNYKNTTLWLHRLLLDAPSDMVVDHINHDTLDNRRSNLRIVTHAQNLQNRKSHQSNSSTGERGVTWVKSNQKWRARVTYNGEQYYGGLFEDKQDAIDAVQKLRAELLPYSTN